MHPSSGSGVEQRQAAASQRRKGLTALTTGSPSIGVRSLARIKGLIASRERHVRSAPHAGQFDSVTEHDASDTSFVAVTFVEGLAAAPSTDARPILRELYGVTEVVLSFAPVLRGGGHKIVMDSLGCVFIIGEAVRRRPKSPCHRLLVAGGPRRARSCAAP